MKIRLVVSRFNEDLSWVNEMPVDEVTVYDKGPREAKIVDSISLDNVGFEANTWAWHFANSCDTCEWTMCLQGDPWPHVRREVVLHWLKVIRERYDLGYVALSMHTALCEIYRPDHVGIPLADWWFRTMDRKPPGAFFPWFGGQFLVHSQAVNAKRSNYWLNIANNCRTKEDACCLERLWQFILG